MKIFRRLIERIFPPKKVEPPVVASPKPKHSIPYKRPPRIQEFVRPNGDVIWIVRRNGQMKFYKLSPKAKAKQDAKQHDLPPAE